MHVLQASTRNPQLCCALSLRRKTEFPFQHFRRPKFQMMLASSILLLLCLRQSVALVATDVPKDASGCFNRRKILTTGAASLLGLSTASSSTSAALAFENKMSSQFDDRPKRKGPKPPDLGVLPRTDVVGEEYKGLKHCGAAPNCFCSTDTLEDDPAHSIPAWVWPQDLGSDKEKAFAQLTEVINAYEPGQSNIDGGGFKIVTYDPKKGYIYVQFESLKNGYIDDLELAYIDGMGDRSIQVRSSSRVGYLDFGVNAKRLNYIAKALRSKGWDAKGVDLDTHTNYAIQNDLM